MRLHPVQPYPEIKEFLSIYRRDPNMAAVSCGCGKSEYSHVATLEIHIRPEFVENPHPRAPISHAAHVAAIVIRVCEDAYLKTLSALARAAELVTENG